MIFIPPENIQILMKYWFIFVYGIIVFALSFILFLISYVLYKVSKRTSDSEKVAPYECGFETFEDARETIDVRFYLVAILFLVFDLEVSFLFSWAITLGDTGFLGLFSMFFFLGLLTIGFIYEWKKGALEWV
jgi:NADH-quinone oxidoreductase subunit A